MISGDPRKNGSRCPAHSPSYDFFHSAGLSRSSTEPGWAVISTETNQQRSIGCGENTNVLAFVFDSYRMQDAIHRSIADGVRGHVQRENPGRLIRNRLPAKFRIAADELFVCLDVCRFLK